MRSTPASRRASAGAMSCSASNSSTDMPTLKSTSAARRRRRSSSPHGVYRRDNYAYTLTCAHFALHRLASVVGPIVSGVCLPHCAVSHRARRETANPYVHQNLNKGVAGHERSRGAGSSRPRNRPVAGQRNGRLDLIDPSLASQPEGSGHGCGQRKLWVSARSSGAIPRIEGADLPSAARAGAGCLASCKPSWLAPSPGFAG